jgi:Zn-dependent protease
MDPTSRPTLRTAWPNAVLFALTVLSTAGVGVDLGYGYLHPAAPGGPPPAAAAYFEPRVLALGALYAAVLMTILTAHELGHYLTCRRYGLAATLPFFFPAPNLPYFIPTPGGLPSPSLMGTFGAFIRIKSRIDWKRQLFDVGAAGPLAGAALAFAALIAGLGSSRVAAAAPGAISLGEPMILKLAARLLFGRLPAGADLLLHPVAFAGWAGLLVTAINLFPIGQLDGGHVAYALVGRRRRLVSRVALAALLVLGVFFSVAWLVWGALGLLYALVLRLKRPGRLYRWALRWQHPCVIDEDVPLDRRRTLLAVLVAVVFVLSFVPDPIRGTSLLALLKGAPAGVR